MPYQKTSELPDTVKKLPAKAKEMYLAAFNAAFEKFEGEDGREAHAHAVAWTAVERKYTKEGGKWVAKESLQTLYSKLLREIGLRNVSDPRITQAVELCSGDESEEALKEVNDTLAWLKEQPVVKVEGDEAYPREAYAYAPTADTSTWRLRLWENGEASRGQLKIAAAYLSPGGYRGEKCDIPKDRLSEVKRRLRSEYRNLEVDDMPNAIKEVESRGLFSSYTPLSEAEVGSKGIARVVVIRPGYGNAVDNHYYPAETLARDYAVFEGAKMYSDHQTEEEERSRPEGSIRQWVASLKNVRFEEGVGIVGDAYIVEPWLQAKLATLRDKDLLAEMGVSIRAAGVGTAGKIEGKEANIVEKITRVRSVDFVTEAGAGGRVLLYESEGLDIDVITLETLEDRRADLVKQIRDATKSETLKEAKQMSELEEKVQALEGNIQTLTTERDELQGKITEAEKAQRIAEAKSVIDDAISKSDLPAAAKARLTERFVGVENAEGVEEAVKAEADYIAALSESGKVRGMGGSQPDAKAKDALKESFVRLGMTEEQATEAAR